MTSNQPQENLPSLSDIISPSKEIEPNNIPTTEINLKQEQENNNIPEEEINTPSQIYTKTITTSKAVEQQQQPQVVKITRKIITSTQPPTDTYVSRKIITTTTRGAEPNKTQNTRYNNTDSTYIPKVTQVKTTTGTSYTRPNVKSTMTVSNNRYANQNNTNINPNQNQNQAYKNYNQKNQPSRIQGSQSYSGNRNLPKRPEVSSSHYQPRAKSPAPGTIKRKTIVRGSPIENIQITHIIYSSRPLEFHIIEELNTENLSKDPIQISENDRNNLQKSGKVEVSCSCDNVELKKPAPVNLDGKLTHYQHALGIGMTDAKLDKINPKFYSSEIKILEPILFNKGEPTVEYLEFRSQGKKYNTTRTVKKVETKPVINYSSNRGTNNYTPSRTYNNTTQLKNPSANNNRGVGSTVKVSTSSNYKGNAGTGSGGGIIKETTTKVQMGSRSQFNSQNKPITTTTTERKVYNQNNLFKK